MQAIRVTQFGGPDVLELSATEAPPLQTDTQVLVEIRAAGVNPVDTYIRAGVYGRLPSLPYTPGIDGAGVVAAVGAAVTEFQVGDRVYGGWPITGTYAQFALYQQDWLYPLPAQVSFEQGACIFVPYSTAYQALIKKGQVRVGDTVLIHGATGAVGLAAVQLAVTAECRVIGTGGTEAGRALVQAQGAHLVLDHHSDTYQDEILAATEGQGVNLIMEMLANVNLGKDLPLLSTGGRVVVVGSRGPVEINPRDLISRDSSIAAVNLFSISAEIHRAIHHVLNPAFREGILKPIVHQAIPLEAAAEAHRRILEPGALGNWVLVP